MEWCVDGNGGGEHVEVIKFNFTSFFHELEGHFPFLKLLLFQTHLYYATVRNKEIFFRL